jgi:hypothetical protein
VIFKNWGKIKFSENYTEDTYFSKKNSPKENSAGCKNSSPK